MTPFSPPRSGSLPGRLALADKWLWWIFATAVAARAGVLIYNLALDLPPYWGFLPRTALALAWSDFGRIALVDFPQQFQISVEQAVNSWYLNDRGLIYLYLLLNALTGHVTYLQVQVLNLAVDALMVFPVMAIAGTFGERQGARAAGLLYALFIPQIQMAAAPDYNAWFSIFLIVLTLLFLRLIAAIEARRMAQAGLLAAALIGVNILANEFRSVLALFCLGAAGWYWLVSSLRWRRLRLPVTAWKSVTLLVVCGAATVGAAASINFAIRGESSPVRSSFGHNFWTGVGQFANPYGLRDDDGSVVEWYTRETGLTESHSTMGVAYNEWLTERAKQFIRENSGSYLSMVARRALHILFPNMAFTIIADLPSFTRESEQVHLTEMRKDLVAANGWLSTTTLGTLLREDPGYVVSLAFRVALLITMPLGLIAALFISNRPAAVALASLPLAYMVICLSPFYATPPVYTSAYTSVIPLVAVGWIGGGAWLCRRRKPPAEV